MEDANGEAVDLLIRQQQDSINQGELDLHGFYVDEAIDCVEDVLDQHRQADQSGRHQLTVITGKGLHSTDGVAKIRPAVIAYLEKHKYKYTLSPGVITVDIQRGARATPRPRGNKQECCLIC
ncbi:smr domain-containing protein C11H11.03c-like [Haliotis rubra]|uniref:smr domain-containing protein C11H11.03c-like n=1 Tax=Haliotis rubra TaxID=36100 RepID=UPI001EE63014|nr:smr domain-containing protein C11H11.03c-like [Haliotis rubra]